MGLGWLASVSRQGRLHAWRLDKPQKQGKAPQCDLLAEIGFRPLHLAIAQRDARGYGCGGGVVCVAVAEDARAVVWDVTRQKRLGKHHWDGPIVQLEPLSGRRPGVVAVVEETASTSRLGGIYSIQLRDPASGGLLYEAGPCSSMWPIRVSVETGPSGDTVARWLEKPRHGSPRCMVWSLSEDVPVVEGNHPDLSSLPAGTELILSPSGFMASLEALSGGV
jgi:hypothetical protein